MPVTSIPLNGSTTCTLKIATYWLPCVFTWAAHNVRLSGPEILSFLTAKPHRFMKPVRLFNCSFSVQTASVWAYYTLVLISVFWFLWFGIGFWFFVPGVILLFVFGFSCLLSRVFFGISFIGRFGLSFGLGRFLFGFRFAFCFFL